MKIILDVVPPTLNVYDRMHWAEKKKLRGLFGQLVMFALFEQGWRMPADNKDVPPMDVSIMIGRPRRLDPDGLWGCVKPLLDGMRDIKALRNDSPRWLKLFVEQEVSRIPRTEIEISEWKLEAPASRGQLKMKGI